LQPPPPPPRPRPSPLNPTPHPPTPNPQTRYEKRHTNISAHISPAFRCREGDRVEIGQCRPLSKTVRFNVLRVIPASGGSGEKKGFSGF